MPKGNNENRVKRWSLKHEGSALNINNTKHFRQSGMMLSRNDCYCIFSFQQYHCNRLVLQIGTLVSRILLEVNTKNTGDSTQGSRTQYVRWNVTFSLIPLRLLKHIIEHFLFQILMQGPKGGLYHHNKFYSYLDRHASSRS